MKRLYSFSLCIVMFLTVCGTCIAQSADRVIHEEPGTLGYPDNKPSSYGTQRIKSGISGSTGTADPAEYSNGGVGTSLPQPPRDPIPKPGDYPPSKKYNVNLMQFDSKVSESARRDDPHWDWLGFIGMLGLAGFVGKYRKKDFY
ncbi:WGxxGxxG-CTERM domain-containing protein [Paenibacillus chitinolyticus]|uniref:WGxxGxxG-CTERM domain-containing protein n=1 Tax=Paenibacillus chitinolyticus TaxID=79263 RepID=UPI002DB66661|nr:WGxxGxxG-CTERM domain-containing protein [Paenibacillus chitinolyticus]MEC0245774.1 WGxxGxxG-CTERM domain-containing protein [Paenibacillus chitinolyticus]